MRTLVVGLLVLVASGLVGAAEKEPAADDQGRIRKILQDICEAARKKELDRLDSFHAYSPRFTKFDDDGLGRQDADAGRKGEREAIAALKSFNARVADVKVDVFGSAAVATFILKYEADTGKEKVSGSDRSTLVFVKDGGTWKIVHEHHSPLKSTP
jgi:ketosteroid isomerase-like protein